MKKALITLFTALSIASASAQVKYSIERGRVMAVWVENRERYADSTLISQLYEIPFDITTRVNFLSSLTQIKVASSASRFDAYLNEANRQIWKSYSK